jgi:hypothetical protein
MFEIEACFVHPQVGPGSSHLANLRKAFRITEEVAVSLMPSTSGQD